MFRLVAILLLDLGNAITVRSAPMAVVIILVTALQVRAEEPVNSIVVGKKRLQMAAQSDGFMPIVGLIIIHFGLGIVSSSLVVILISFIVIRVSLILFLWGEGAMGS